MAEIGLMLMGGFYVYAGIMATRTALATAFFDRAMAQNAGRETPALEALRTIWLVGGSSLIALSGVALLLLLDWSRYLFVTAALVQGTYLHIADPYLFGKSPSAVARDQRLARMAYMIFLAATCLVLIASHFDRLQGLGAVPTQALVMVSIIAAAISGYGLWRSSTEKPDDL